MTHTIKGFVATGRPRASADAARLIGDVQAVPQRDHAVALMTRQESSAHAALWKDLLTRSPEQARTPVASLAAFGAWLHGNGMAARLALEPLTDPGDRMARLITAMVTAGADPKNWKPPHSASGSLQERVDPPAKHNPRKEIPRRGRAQQGPPR